MGLGVPFSPQIWTPEVVSFVAGRCRLHLAFEAGTVLSAGFSSEDSILPHPERTRRQSGLDGLDLEHQWTSVEWACMFFSRSEQILCISSCKFHRVSMLVVLFVLAEGETLIY